MPSTTDFRKTLTDPTPLYFAAGVIEKVRAEAPERIAQVRATDPKAVQERVQGVLANLDADLRKLRDQAQHFALQGVGYAAEYAVKAKEGYDSLAEQGKNAVENWRDQGGTADSVTYETTIEREPVTVADKGTASQDRGETKTAPKSSTAGTASKSTTAKSTSKAAPKSTAKTSAASSATSSNGVSASTSATGAGGSRKTTAKKSAPRKSAAPKSDS
ncbi:hypothetical protein MTQ01_19745 [Streptomyces sp. XM4193]|uniref:hypothetical protein n=1 Tax=Streptomyces sp. XM4193 TaxID=2929782 RepID=UPI001FFA7EC3|nr:hypothetical protein [Streptomyces sp. XM4193]MCK1798218.1 hypothetical protein [Streptomyces sp. XM4193]